MSTKHNPLEVLLGMDFTEVVSLFLAWGENVDRDDLVAEGWTYRDDIDFTHVRSALESMEERHCDEEDDEA